MNPQVLYRVRVKLHASRSINPWITRGLHDLPIWTWVEPRPLSLGEAECLRRDTLKVSGGAVELEVAE